ncbi:hypothetical protein [Actinacidiphila acidipaludis]|uniref:Uncharacterized protein n=1 Tax=Actinacidiphila acidipaludis TaxID=2873382 RepID=A0ABS7QJ38_9ACTN|nr:hypothetical protein [Streptomyces acidipaludis]MBY8882993.1 hypothetical protein [Streptomyces acidipaludis]
MRTPSAGALLEWLGQIAELGRLWGSGEAEEDDDPDVIEAVRAIQVMI